MTFKGVVMRCRYTVDIDWIGFWIVYAMGGCIYCDLWSAKKNKLL